MKYFWLIGYFIIAIIYGFIAYLVADYAISDYSYWIRILWCGMILSFVYLSIGMFQRKASEQNSNAPLFIVFAWKMLILGVISIVVCIRSYFFHPDWMEVINLITQGVISIYMAVLAINLIFVANLENKSQLQVNQQRSYTGEYKELFAGTKNLISLENLRLFNSVTELFNKTIIIVKTDEQILRLNQIKNTLSLITIDSTKHFQNKQLLRVIEQVNNFYR